MKKNRKTMIDGQYLTVLGTENQSLNAALEKGTVLSGLAPDDVLAGNIKTPKIVISNADAIRERVGLRVKNREGRMIECIAYRRYCDIDIRFEDGTVLYHRNFGSFMKGSVRHPEDGKPGKPYVGQTSVAKNGMSIKIIASRGARDNDVRFEDGSVVRGVSLYSFRSGNLRYPGEERRDVKSTKSRAGRKPATERRGTKLVSRYGEKMEIVDYRNSHDMDVRVGRELLRDVTWFRFKNGKLESSAHRLRRLQEEEIARRSTRESRGIEARAAKYVGMTRPAENGQMMTIIAYNGDSDLTIKFEDETIVHGKTLHRFMSGFIANPNCRIPRSPRRKAERIGETNHNRFGEAMTIIAYLRNDNITVQFDDGSVREHVSYSDFRSGRIRRQKKTA